MKGKILQLEYELQKQRDRCLALIEEKEDEVASLKSSVSIALEAALSAAAQAVNPNIKASSPNRFKPFVLFDVCSGPSLEL